MKGQVIAPTYILAFIFVIVVFVVGSFTIFSTNFRIKIGLITATEGMQSLAILNKLIADPNCLATEGGRIGILDMQKIDAARGPVEHPCANLPNFGYQVTIFINRSDGKALDTFRSFGQQGIGRAGYRSFPVAVRDGAKTYPAQITMGSWYESGEDGDILLRARSMVEQAFLTKGTYERAFPIGDYILDFRELSICLEGQIVKRNGFVDYCRGFVNAGVKINNPKKIVIKKEDLCKVIVKYSSGGVEVDSACLKRP